MRPRVLAPYPPLWPAYAAGAVFVALAAAMAIAPEPWGLDAAVHDALVPWSASNQWGDSGREVAVDYAILAVVTGGLFAAAWRYGQPILAAGVVVSLILQEVVVRIVKSQVGRPRPPEVYSQSGAFPSGHTATVALTILLFTLLVLPLVRRTTRPTGQDLVWAAAAAVLFGLVRLSSGEHWTTDIAGGLALATAWGVATARILTPWARPAGRSR